jgi:broad specificity phosphatase PhoE
MSPRLAPTTSSTTLSSANGKEAANADDSTGAVISSSSSTRREPWKVFPAHQWEQLQELHNNTNNSGPASQNTRVKLVHFVRHAEGTHNVDQDYKSERQLDARLTELGHAQCQALAERIRKNGGGATTDNNDNTDNLWLRAPHPEHMTTCIVTSPLTRCVQTALGSFPHLLQNVPVIVAHEAWRETVNYQCDRRRPMKEIRREFPQVEMWEDDKRQPQIDDDDDDDALWNEYRQRLGEDWESHMESAELYRVAERGFEGLRALEDRPESQIVVCTHSAFLRCILNWGQEGGVPMLMPQDLDDRSSLEKTTTTTTSAKLLDYSNDNMMVAAPDDQGDGNVISFEEYMRRDFENCELRSFCMLMTTQSSS